MPDSTDCAHRKVALTMTAKSQVKTAIPLAIATPDHVETRLGTLKFLDGFSDDATCNRR